MPAYFVLSVNQPTDSLEMLGRNPASLVLRRLLVPPWIYLRGLGLFGLMAVRPTFLLGHAYSHGVWFYFPVVFLLKTPLPAVAAFLLAIPVALLAKRNRPWKTAIIPADRQTYWRAAWVFLAVFTAFCIISHPTSAIARTLQQCSGAWPRSTRLHHAIRAGRNRYQSIR